MSSGLKAEHEGTQHCVTRILVKGELEGRSLDVGAGSRLSGRLGLLVSECPSAGEGPHRWRLAFVPRHLSR